MVWPCCSFLHVCPSACLFSCPTVCLSVHLSFQLSGCLAGSLIVHPSIPVCLFISLPSVSPSADMIFLFWQYLWCDFNYFCMDASRVMLWYGPAVRASMSVLLHVCLAVRLSVCPSVCPSICLAVGLSVRQPACLSIRPSMSLCLFICLLSVSLEYQWIYFSYNNPRSRSRSLAPGYLWVCCMSSCFMSVSTSLYSTSLCTNDFCCKWDYKIVSVCPSVLHTIASITDYPTKVDTLINIILSDLNWFSYSAYGEMDRSPS